MNEILFLALLTVVTTTFWHQAAATKKVSICDKEKTISKKIIMNAGGIVHCYFMPHDQSPVKKISNGKGYSMNLDEANRICGSFDSTLPQIISKIMHVNLKLRFKLSNDFKHLIATGFYFPLGLKVVMTKKRSDIQPPLNIENVDIAITWGMGAKSTMNPTEGFGGLHSWANSDLDGITYMTRLGWLMKTYAKNSYPHHVGVICHQDSKYPVESPQKTVMDICGGQSPEVTKMANFLLGNDVHCVFKLPNQDAIRKNEKNEYTFTLADLIEACRMYSAGVLELRNADMYNEITNVLPEVESDAIHFPLGILKKNVISGTNEPRVDEKKEFQIKATWLNGDDLAVQESTSFGSMLWQVVVENGTPFLDMPEGNVIITDPSNMAKELIFLCHEQIPFEGLHKETKPPAITYNTTETNDTTTESPEESDSPASMEPRAKTTEGQPKTTLTKAHSMTSTTTLTATSTAAITVTSTTSGAKLAQSPTTETLSLSLVLVYAKMGFEMSDT